VDLFCGKGGWTIPALLRGWTCVGFDIVDHGYPGDLHTQQLPVQAQEIRQLRPDLVVASPPCEEFARCHLPWIRQVKPPDLTLLRWSIDLITDLFPIPVIVECSRFSARHIAGARFCGPYALWGTIPALLPQVLKRKARMSGTNPAARAIVDAELAAWLIHLHTPLR
jgi:hypothetical protein